MLIISEWGETPVLKTPITKAVGALVLAVGDAWRHFRSSEENLVNSNGRSVSDLRALETESAGYLIACTLRN